MDGYSIFTAIASPAAGFGMVKWALAKYEKQSKDLEDERRRHIAGEISGLKRVTEHHESIMEALRKDFSALDKNFAIILERIKFNSDDVEKLLKAYGGFVESCAHRFGEIETQVKELSKDVFRVSTRKKGE